MAKIDLYDSSDEKVEPGSKTSLEVRVWGLGGNADQMFNIGSGSNFSGAANTWLEILYTLRGVNLFYTRNFLHHYHGSAENELESLEKFAAGELDRYGYGDTLPETGLLLQRHTNTYNENTYTRYSLEVCIDTGAVFNFNAPGEEMITFQLPHISLEKGVRFMREFILELDQANQGKHPDPGKLPAQSGDWPFALQLNRQAYDLVASQYQEEYFANPALSGQFETWLQALPSGGHVLDAGCGHGDPAITRLLESGFRATGIDLSPEMLRLAGERFPSVPFINLAVTQLAAEAEFDGACSLSSMLYLDPVDFFHAIYRLHQALKPGGLLFLYGYDTHPGWRGHPYDQVLDQWMWSWTRSLDEAVSALEEHGYFTVLQAVEVTLPREDESEDQPVHPVPLEEVVEAVENLPPEAPQLEFPGIPTPKRSKAYAYTILARRKD
jgi:SAM-dependent methyltransferase